ncbi:MAG: TMEM175 family protein [Bacteroidota bacterium]|nr:TMEM175 family protein [Bacteroidota bacterium]
MKISTARLETFSDCVIAIIITIMILELRLPNLDKHTASATQILAYLHSLLPYFITYAFSYMMIGIFWTNHHHMFFLLETTDETLLWQNFLFMFMLSLIPFATALVGTNPFIPLSPAIYGLVMLLTTGSFVLMRNYSIQHGLVHKDKNRDLRRKIYKVSLRARTKGIIGALVYLASIPLAYVNIYIAYALFVIPALIFFVPEGIDSEKLAADVSGETK